MSNGDTPYDFRPSCEKLSLLRRAGQPPEMPSLRRPRRGFTLYLTSTVMPVWSSTTRRYCDDRLAAPGRDYEYRGLMEEADREVLEFIGDQGKTAEQVSDRFPAFDLERLVRAELARPRRTNPVKSQSRHTPPRTSTRSTCSRLAEPRQSASLRTRFTPTELPRRFALTSERARTSPSYHGKD